MILFENEFLKELLSVQDNPCLSLYQPTHRKANQLTTSELKEIGRAAVAGRIGKLLVEENKIIPGKIVDEMGKMKRGDLEHPEVDDLLDDVTTLVMRQGGEVHLLPAENMPADTGVAAIFRY